MSRVETKSMLNRFQRCAIKRSIELDAQGLDQAGQVVGIEAGAVQPVICGIDDPIGRAPEVGFPQVGAVEDDIAQPAIGPRGLPRIGLALVSKCSWPTEPRPHHAPVLVLLFGGADANLLLMQLLIDG